MAAAAAAPEPNLVLAGRYRLEQRLGAGGMGAIWRAEHLVLRAPVAVKLLERDAVPDDDTVARFLREAQAAATLRSPHVVQIIDYGVDNRWPFIVMELLEGENLAQRLKRVKRLPPEEAVRIFAQVARAVARAHEAGIVHRDLKPENVFLVQNEDDEIAKVLDFGVAKVSSTAMNQGEHDSARTRTGSILGTPYFMSPEQAQGNKTVDTRSDLWSLGVMAFECLTGKRPFFSDGLGDLVLSICVRDIPVPSDSAPVPIGFDAWFSKAVARDPDHRFQSAREMSSSLRDALGIEIDRGSDPDIVVSRTERKRDTMETGEPMSERDTEEVNPPNSAVPTANVHAKTPRPDSERGSVVQVSRRGASESDADVNAATMVASASEREGDERALTDAQFGTSQAPTGERRTSLGPVIAVALGALGIGLAAGFVVLSRTQSFGRASATAPVRSASQPRLRPAPQRADTVSPETDPTGVELIPPPAIEDSALPPSSAAAPSASAASAGPGKPGKPGGPSASASAAPAASATAPTPWVKPAWAIPDDEPVRKNEP